MQRKNRWLCPNADCPKTLNNFIISICKPNFLSNFELVIFHQGLNQELKTFTGILEQK